MSRPSRLGLALAAAVAASSLFVGGGLASATPTAACDAQKAALAGAASDAKATAQQALDDCLKAQQTSTAPTSTTTTTTSSKAAPPSGGSREPSAGDPQGGQRGRPEGNTDNNGTDQKPPHYKPWKGDKGDARKDRNDPPRRPGDEKDCRDFDNRDEAQKWYEDHKRPGDKDPSRLDHDKDGKACENADDDGDDSDPVIPPKVDVTVIVNQTQDDGSTATVSGSQVKDVPKGSVNTGSAQ